MDLKSKLDLCSKAIEHAEKAISLDDNLAEAHIVLSQGIMEKVFEPSLDSERKENQEKFFKHTDKAYSLDPDNPDAIMMKGFSFYMKRDPENEKLALGVDMIAPEGFGEIIGGGQREDDHDTLLKRIKEHELPVEPFQWYLDLRKYGSVPHSGFGLGLERTVGWICGTKHIRETIPYPRTMYRIEP